MTSERVAVKRDAPEDAEAFLAAGMWDNDRVTKTIVARLVELVNRHASRADTAMRRVVELEAEVVRLEEARRS